MTSREPSSPSASRSRLTVVAHLAVVFVVGALAWTVDLSTSIAVLTIVGVVWLVRKRYYYAAAVATLWGGAAVIAQLTVSEPRRELVTGITFMIPVVGGLAYYGWESFTGRTP